jgi:hypothetical protein
MLQPSYKKTRPFLFTVSYFSLASQSHSALYLVAASPCQSNNNNKQYFRYYTGNEDLSNAMTITDTNLCNY